MLMLLSSVAANKPKIISPNYEPLPDFCGKRFLTTYLTITGFGAHGDSGDESFKEQLFRNKRCQKGAENVRKKFHELFGIKTPGARISPLGPVKTAVFTRNQPFFPTFYIILVSTARGLTTYYFFAFTLILQTFFLYKCRYFFLSKYFPNLFVSFGVTRTECFKNDP